MTHPVIDVITQHSRSEQHRAECGDVHAPGCRRSASDEQQRIAGKKGEDHHARLAKDNGEENGIDPGSILLNEHRKMLVEMQDKVEKLRKY